jgi:adenine/guanine phosphoribosyltransferase-like PRPP-binding protein
LRIKLDNAVKTLDGLDFDAIAFQGMSGALFASPLSLRINKPIIMVRKESDKNHSGLRAEGYQATKKYLFVDDFISSGKTFDHVKEVLNSFAPDAQCIGTYVYNYNVLTVLPLAEVSNVMSEPVPDDGSAAAEDIPF